MSGIVILPMAQRDLIEIGDYIALDHPARARSFVEEIERTIFDRIALRPMSFTDRADLMPGLRSAAHGRYLIFFLVADANITIVRVLHGARNLKQVLGS